MNCGGALAWLFWVGCVVVGGWYYGAIGGMAGALLGPFLAWGLSTLYIKLSGVKLLDADFRRSCAITLVEMTDTSQPLIGNTPTRAKELKFVEDLLERVAQDCIRKENDLSIDGFSRAALALAEKERDPNVAKLMRDIPTVAEMEDIARSIEARP